MMDPNNAVSMVISILEQATNQDPNILKPAEEQLQKWEAQPGFYSTLAAISINQSVDTNVRWLAVLYFKNGVERYWRHNAPNAISEEEKTFLKQQLILNFSEPVHQIATQHAVLIGKIARLDCPRQWQELIPTLLEVLKSDSPLVQQRALLTLHHVVKALASRRLAPDRKAFEELTINLFSFILLLWNSSTGGFFQALQVQDLSKAALVFDHALLALKVLRRLVVFGFKTPQDHQDVTTFISAVFERLEAFLKAKNEIQALSRELLPKREKILTTLTKVILDFQEYHPKAFIKFIRQSLEFTVRFNFTDEGQDLLYDRFQVNTFNITRSILRCDAYRPAKTIEETKNPLTIEAYKAKMEFFTSDTLSEIGRRLILRYFLLSEYDLEIWDADPEEFVGDEGGDSWKYSLRPCTENLYLTLMKEFRTSLTPVVLKLMQEYQGPADQNDMQAILRKDAVMNAAGLASFDLYDDVDFDGWFTSSLVRDLQNKHPNYRIIRRRVIWLLGCWVGVKLSSQMRPVLYETLVPFLNPNEDLVVRLETAFTIRCVDDFDFSIKDFSPYLQAYFGSLFQLLIDLSECETKMQVLNVMSFIIERMKTQVQPYSSSLIGYLPMLWKNSEEHNLLRCAIITTLTNLVWGLGSVCVTMYEFLLPVIKLSTDVTEECHIYLYEDALDLWLATIQSSPTVTESLLKLYENMPSLLELGGDAFRTCIKITESYVLLGPREFLQMFSPALVSSLITALTDLKNEGVVMVYKVVELVCRIVPELGPNVFVSMLPEVLRAVIEENEYPMVTGIKLTILARIMLQNQTFFFEYIEEISKLWGSNGNDILGKLLDSWFDKMDNVIQPERRKLMSLAFLSLLSNNISVIGEKFSGIVNVVVETLHDVCKTDDDGTEQDSFVLDNQSDLPTTDELVTEHDRRKKTVSMQDPVFSVSLKDYTKSQLNIYQGFIGIQNFELLMESVDCEIVEQLKQFIK